MTNMIRLSLYGQYHAGDKRHAQEVMRDIGVAYMYAVPQSIADCWMFFGVNKDAQLPYDWLSMEEVDAQEFVGFGLSQEMADALDEGEMK